MGKELYTTKKSAKKLFDEADDVLGFSLTDCMLTGTAEDLRRTRVTQPAIFLCSVATALTDPSFLPQAVAGHSLGEFSALVAARALSFRDALHLVQVRANLMQEACEMIPSTMAAVLGLQDETIEDICRRVQNEVGCVVVPANYNTKHQVVISGDVEGVALVTEAIKRKEGARVLPLSVGGAFHSPLMAPAKEQISDAIFATTFAEPICPIYQNYSAQPTRKVFVIQKNLVEQLTAPVRWRQLVEQMIKDGYESFVECGPKSTLTGLIKKIDARVRVKHL